MAEIIPDLQESRNVLHTGWCQYEVYVDAAGYDWPPTNMALLDDLWRRAEIHDEWLSTEVNVEHPVVDAYGAWLESYKLSLVQHVEYVERGRPISLELGEYLMGRSDRLYAEYERIRDTSLDCSGSQSAASGGLPRP